MILTLVSPGRPFLVSGEILPPPEQLGWARSRERVHWSQAELSVRVLCSSSSHTASVSFSRSFSAEIKAIIYVNVGMSDLDNDDNVHDQDADARDDLGQDALENHHNHPHWVFTNAPLLIVAPAVLITKLIMTLTWLKKAV